MEPITAGSMLGHGTQLLREKPVSYSLKLERTQGKFQYKRTSHIGQGPGPKAAPRVPSPVPHVLGWPSLHLEQGDRGAVEEAQEEEHDEGGGHGVEVLKAFLLGAHLPLCGR